MKTLILILIAGLLSACQAVPGHDGRTYYWIAPLPSGDVGYHGSTRGVNIYQPTVNGVGYQVITTARGR